MTDDTDRIKIAKMLGWTEIRPRDFGECLHFLLGIPPESGPEVLDYVPDFFTDAAAANKVVVAMAKRGLTFTQVSYLNDGMHHDIAFLAEGGRTAGHASGAGESASPFICQAALQAVAAKGGDDV